MPTSKATSKKTAKTKPGRSVPLLGIALILSLSILAYIRWLNGQVPDSAQKIEDSPTIVVAAPISLPKPSLTSRTSVEAAMQTRRSRRDFTGDSLNIKQVGQMLWSAQGVTTDWGGRTAPSAKSAYPLTVYLVATKVIDLAPGIYQYLPGEREAVHQIQLIKQGDLHTVIGTAIGQNAATNPPALIIIAADMAKMAKAFDGVRNDNNVYLEVGHAAQNMYLQAESLGLGMVSMAGFDGTKVAAAAGIPANETIIYAIPFGIPKP
ncbi:SagB/ThcOx family dehydrogenase [Candidatus Collierbacteria bacterium]|nr:SagB/ThcOx family dehydrogenase [Candidatus Collierbacteria bacterium]